MAELWDVYDKNKNLIGKTIRRDIDPLLDGEYHLVVHVWIKQPDGRWLISKRTANKPNPLKWECTGGSVLAGEDSLTAAIRETKEELGIDLNPDNGKLIHTNSRVWKNPSNFPFLISRDILDVYVFEQKVSLEDIVFQEDETCDAKFATSDEIIELIKNEEFVGAHHFSYLDKIFKNNSCKSTINPWNFLKSEMQELTPEESEFYHQNILKHSKRVYDSNDCVEALEKILEKKSENNDKSYIQGIKDCIKELKKYKNENFWKK